MTSKELKIMLDDNYDKAMNYNLVPKDWKPRCYEGMVSVNGCLHGLNYPVERCEQCPYNEARK